MTSLATHLQPERTQRADGQAGSPTRRPRLAYVITHPTSAQHLLRGQLAFMQASGFDVTLITSPGEELRLVEKREGVTVRPVLMPREIRPLQDAKAFAQLAGALRALKPDVVNAGTTKAGLLGMMAARLVGVPVRVYLLRGLRLETSAGPQRALLSLAEHASARCATRIVAVSHSLEEKYVARGYAPAGKVTVLAGGSSNGVDVEHFAPSANGRAEEAAALRAQLGIPDEAPVIGFVGRFTRDKGIVDLMGAFEELEERFPEARLLLVGDFEEGDPVPAACVRKIVAHPRVVRPGFVDDVAPYYALMDVLAFPSRREGFPNVPLEAAAARVPVVGARATGTVDAVEDGVTGALVAQHDARGLAAALGRYLSDEALRQAHGQAAEEHVAERFRPERVWKALHGEYARLLRAAGRPLPLHSA